MIRRYSVLFAVVAILSIHCLRSADSSPVRQLPDEVIYDDGLNGDWRAAGDAIFDLGSTTPTRSGSYAVGVDFGGRGRLEFQHGGFNTYGYDDLRFWIHGGATGGQALEVYVLDWAQRPSTPVNLAGYVTVPANAWVLADLPLADLGATETLITGIGWQEPAGNDLPTLHLDDIGFKPADDSAAPDVVSWEVHPWAIPADGATQTVITATVNDPQGDLERVSIDLTALGRAAEAILYDDGAHNDGTAQDGVFGLITTAGVTAQTGETPLTLTATDQQGHRAVRYLGTFLVLTPSSSPWPEGLPPHLGWGSMEREWQSATGLPWNYQAQFLGWDWQTWNANYVRNIAQAAWSQGYIPVFTVEMVLGGADCGGLAEKECAFAHLQDAALVEGYFDRLAVAAQQAAGDEAVIFHIEPDVSAYLHRYSIEHDGENGIVADDPNTVPAQSGQGYADTYAGVIQRMLDVIQQQAPNALVGLHARSWATGMDVAVNSSADLDVDEIARRTAHFLTAAGGTELDLIFVDWKNLDAGSGGSPWWDDANLTWPHFNRILHFENRLAYHAGRPLVLWRVPLGNMSLPNICGQYQDNRVDYAFTHVRDLVDVGIAAVVLGGGGDCRTNPSSDGGNVERKAAVYYAAPAPPSDLNAVAPGISGLVKLSWAPNTEFDLWGYRVYSGRGANDLALDLDARRQTSAQVILPEPGEWYLSVAAYDSRGVESQLPPAIMVQVTEAHQLYLPLFFR